MHSRYFGSELSPSEVVLFMADDGLQTLNQIEAVVVRWQTNLYRFRSIGFHNGWARSERINRELQSKLEWVACAVTHPWRTENTLLIQG